MLVLLSPAKKMDFERRKNGLKYSQPFFREESQQLINKLRTLSRNEIARMMHISSDLAELNYNRYQAWQLPFDKKNSGAALFSFRGDAYLGLDADSMSDGDLEFAQGHLRILSGLHGILRPLDRIQPHRLEMGTSLAVRRKKNLYDFWKDKITLFLREELDKAGHDTVINLASKEYFRCIDIKKIPARIISCHFREFRDGDYKSLMLFVKKARGMMTRYIIDNRIEDPDMVKGFDGDGYSFEPVLSSGNDWHFVRGK